MLDTIDYKVIEALTTNGRITWAELATLLGLSAPSTADRVKRLEEKGIIKGYYTRFNYVELGYGLTAFIAVTLTHPKYRATFLKTIHKCPEIEECHHIAGDDDYLLKVRCQNTLHLDELLCNTLKTLPGISRTRTTITLSSPKESMLKIVNAGPKKT